MRKQKHDGVFVIRNLATLTVAKLEPVYGSKMLAYEKVASVIGVSASWVRKFVTVPGTPEPRWSVGFALVVYYRSLCDRVDVQVNRQRREIAKIIGEINEADPLADDEPLSVALAKRFDSYTLD